MYVIGKHNICYVYYIYIYIQYYIQVAFHLIDMEHMQCFLRNWAPVERFPCAKTGLPHHPRRRSNQCPHVRTRGMPPIAGWFLFGKILSKWMMTRGTPMTMESLMNGLL